jgi:hypothetical protein
MSRLLMLGSMALGLCLITPPARAGGEVEIALHIRRGRERREAAQRKGAIQDRAIRHFVFKNQKVANKIYKLERKASEWASARPDPVKLEQADRMHLGWLGERWDRFVVSRHGAAMAKLKPLADRRLEAVRNAFRAAGGDPMIVSPREVNVLGHQLMLDLPRIRTALAREGIRLKSLRPEDAAKLLDSSRSHYDEKGDKVFSFDPVAIANAKHGVF